MPGDAVVHVVDDDAAVRESLGFLLDAAGFAVRCYDSASALLEALPGLGGGRGCVVTDVRMPEMDGIELLHRLRGGGHALPVIVMTGHGDVPLAVAAMKAGAFDFVEKPFDDDALIAAVRAAFDLGARTAATRAAAAEVAARVEALSRRERQVLDGLVAGQPNKLIARELGISPRTVEIYRANIMTKMQAGSVSELIRLVMGIGPVTR